MFNGLGLHCTSAMVTLWCLKILVMSLCFLNGVVAYVHYCLFEHRKFQKSHFECSLSLSPSLSQSASVIDVIQFSKQVFYNMTLSYCLKCLFCSILLIKIVLNKNNCCISLNITQWCFVPKPTIVNVLVMLRS